jgi:uncharacterized protein (DUF427 family)
MARATWNGEVLAQSDDCVVVEGNQYFPLESVRKEFLSPSTHHTICSWKGEASYYNVVVNGSTNENAAWYYETPSEAAKSIKGRIAFWKGVKVEA